MSYIKLCLMEGKKLFQQREIYIALFLSTALFSFSMNGVVDPLNTVVLWKELASVIPYGGFWSIAFLVVVGVARCLPFEREQEMEVLLFTFKEGRIQLLIVKQIVTLIYCAVIVFYFYMVAFFILTINYDVTSLFVQVKVDSPNYFEANPEWTFAKLLIYEYGYTVLASYIFALFTLLLSLFIKRSVFIMMIVGSIFAVGELYDKFLHQTIGTMKWGEHISAIYEYGFNGMLSYRYLGSFKPFSESEVYVLFLLITILIFTLNLFIGRWRRYASLGD